MFGQSESEPVKQQHLGLVRFNYAANAQLAAGILRQRQDHVGALDAAQFVANGARAVTQPGAAFALLPRLPQDVGQEARPGYGPGPRPRADARWARSQAGYCQWR